MRELKSELDAGRRPFLLDVRNPDEHALCHLQGSYLIPVSQLSKRLAELSPGDDIVVYCHAGVRSAHAASILRKAGFSSVRSLKGGIDAWAREVDPGMPRY